MDSSACSQTWPETGNTIGKGCKLAWTQVHQGKGSVLRQGQATL